MSSGKFVAIEGLVGADLEAVCREVATLAVREFVELTRDGQEAGVEDIQLEMAHFERALDAVASGTGADAEQLEGMGQTV